MVMPSTGKAWFERAWALALGVVASLIAWRIEVAIGTGFLSTAGLNVGEIGSYGCGHQECDKRSGGLTSVIRARALGLWKLMGSGAHRTSSRAPKTHMWKGGKIQLERTDRPQLVAKESPGCSVKRIALLVRRIEDVRSYAFCVDAYVVVENDDDLIIAWERCIHGTGAERAAIMPDPLVPFLGIDVPPHPVPD